MSIFDTATDTAPADAGTTAPVDTPVAPAAPAMPDVADAAAMPDMSQAVADAAAPATGVEGAPPAPQYLDVEQFGTHLVKIKVDGEERELPFSEVRNGLMMQQAFTQRTQELAEERRRLAQAEALVSALDSDPAKVIKELTDIYDVDPENGFQPIQRSPQELALRQQAQQAQQLQSQMAAMQFQNEIAQLRQQFGQDIDLQPAAKYAHERPGMTITDAYKAVQFEQLRQQQLQAAEATRRQQAAAQAAGVTHNAGSGQRGVAATPPAQVNSIRDAFFAAKRAHT